MGNRLGYCLALELDDPGFDYSVLSELRDRMADRDPADRLLAVRYNLLPRGKGAVLEYVLQVGENGLRILRARCRHKR
nr:hypothetical protein [Streptacidiphilus pinicola]